jgi:decaprenylphospho-beta-D-erythro-pentofuranosid-2-ulose 2-reductase
MRNGLGKIQNVLILGSSSEIGNAIIEKLSLSSDSKVIRLGVSESADIKFDLTKALDFNFIENLFNGADVDLVLIASGVLGLAPDVEENEEVIRMVQVNFLGTVAFLHAISRKMIKQGHGQILVVTSVAGIRPRKANYIYGSTKAGLEFYSRGLAADLTESGVSLKIVKPGFVFTRMTNSLTPAPFSRTPEALAGIVMKNLNKQRMVIYVPGILRYVFFLLRMLPNSIFLRIK